MTRSEFVQRLVLNEISDDFESVDQIIFPKVAETRAKCGLTIERSEIVEALSQLIAAGLAKVYTLPGPARDPFAAELPGTPPTDEVEEDFRTFFYITKAGMEAHLADDDWWPFDDDENNHLKPGWRLPD